MPQLRSERAAYSWTAHPQLRAAGRGQRDRSSFSWLADAAAETRLRALVSETTLADLEHHEAQKHADAMAKERDSVVASITELERAQDELLDKLVAETR